MEITNFFVPSILFGILAIFIYQSIIKVRNSPYLIIGFFFFGLHSMFEALEIQSYQINIFINFLLILALYSFFLHYQSLSSINKLSTYINNTLISLIVTSFILNLLIGLKVISITELNFSNFQFLLISISGVIVFVYGFNTMFKSYKLTRDNTIVFEIFALFLIVIGYSFIVNSILISYIIRIPLLEIQELATIPMTFGLVLFLLTYLFNHEYTYKLPFPIYEFLIYNTNGLLIYDQRVESPGYDNNINLDLLTGMFSAISSIIQESMGTNINLKKIDIDPYKIVFTRIEGTNLIFAIITTKYAQMLQNSVKRFIKNLPEIVKIKLNNDLVNRTVIQKDLDEIFVKMFPYVTFS